MDKAHSHLSTKTLVAVMLQQTRLSEQESDHLAHCEICKREMVEGVQKEIGAAPNEPGTAPESS